MNSNQNSAVNRKSRLSVLAGIITFKRRARASASRQAYTAQAPQAEWSQTYWGRKFMKSVSLMLALVCSASLALADVKITTKSTAGGQTFTSTTYIKGSRQRIEGMGYTTIYQCDLKRMIQINDKTRTYVITPVGSNEAAKGTAQQAARAPRRSGVVTYTTTYTDTGERKQVLGLAARRLKARTVIAASEGACNPMNMEMETDGWYVDLPGGLGCAADNATPQFPVDQSDCVDEVRFKTEGTAKTGYPVSTTTKIKFGGAGGGGEDGLAVNMPTSSTMQEVVDISTATLDATLFDVPAGYREVKSTQELGSPY